MDGTLQKIVSTTTLPCASCAQFRDDDPDLYYCLLQKNEFPGLCDQFATKSAMAEAQARLESSP